MEKSNKILLSDASFYQKILKKYHRLKKNSFGLPIMIFFKNARHFLSREADMNIVFNFHFNNRSLSFFSNFSTYLLDIKHRFSWFLEKVELMFGENLHVLKDVIKINRFTDLSVLAISNEHPMIGKSPGSSFLSTSSMKYEYSHSVSSSFSYSLYSGKNYPLRISGNIPLITGFEHHLMTYYFFLQKDQNCIVNYPMTFNTSLPKENRNLSSGNQTIAHNISLSSRSIADNQSMNYDFFLQGNRKNAINYPMLISTMVQSRNHVSGNQMTSHDIFLFSSGIDNHIMNYNNFLQKNQSDIISYPMSTLLQSPNWISENQTTVSQDISLSSRSGVVNHILNQRIFYQGDQNNVNYYPISTNMLFPAIKIEKLQELWNMNNILRGKSRINPQITLFSKTELKENKAYPQADKYRSAGLLADTRNFVREPAELIFKRNPIDNIEERPENLHNERKISTEINVEDLNKKVLPQTKEGEIQLIASKVYRLLERRLLIEKEKRGLR